MNKSIVIIGLLYVFTSPIFSQNPQWIIYNTSNSGLAGDIVLSILIDEYNTKWMGTYFDGLSVFDGINWINYDSNTPGWNGMNRVHQIAKDDFGMVWVRTDYDLIHFDGTTWTTCEGGIGGPCPVLEALAVEGNGTAWVGSVTLMEDGCGLNYTTNGSTWSYYYTFNSGIPDDMVTYIAIDADGNKWLNCNGLTKFTGTNWTNYNTGLPNNYIKSIAFENEYLWIGTQGGGLTQFDGTNWITYNTYNSEMPSNFVTSIAIDVNGTKWIGTEDSGLIAFDGSTFTIFNSNNSGLPNHHIHAIAIDENGSKWLGTNEGVAVFNENGIPVSVDEKFTKACNVKVFPNPVRTELQIEGTMGIHISQVEIIGIWGNSIQNHPVTGNRIRIDVHDLPSGTYFIELKTDHGLIRKKMSKL
ncbi:MAG: T9SS type A sorting domain-containing protein [Bacteroidetes bacterium]|nr:T9SS type A sorting domain-containing protein [Bacteroidota bacterium]